MSTRDRDEQIRQWLASYFGKREDETLIEAVERVVSQPSPVLQALGKRRKNAGERK